MENLYDILGINRDATSEEIKKAYAVKVRRYSPEKEPEMFQKIKQAYETLINPTSRAQYDEKLGYEDKETIEPELKKEETLYDILGIESNATEKEIKVAYAAKVRRYSPEKDPEMFQKIKQAYEILINPESREEYDVNIQYGEEIREHEINELNAWNSEDYKTVVKECKKILYLNKNLHKYLYRLSLALYYDNQLDEAIKYAIQLLDMCPNIYEYHKHIAILYMDKEEYSKSEVYFLSAHDLQTLDESIVSYLVDVYIEIEKYKKAIIFLQENIGNNKGNKFGDFVYYENMIKVYIAQNNIDEIIQVMDKIEEELISDEDDKRQVADKLYEIASDIYNKRLYEFAEVVAYRSKQLFEDEYINSLYKEIKEHNTVHKLYDKLDKDERIAREIKGPIHYFAFGGRYEDEEELQRHRSENLQQIQRLINDSPGVVIRSVSMLEKEYTELFDYRRELYLEILNRAEDSEMFHQQYRDLKRDFNIPLGVEHLVSFWMNSDNLTEEESRVRFEEIMNEINTDRKDDIYRGVKKIKEEYFKVYDLNPDFIDELEGRFRPKVSNTNTSRKNTNTVKNSTSDGVFGNIVVGVLLLVFAPTILSGILFLGGVIIELVIFVLGVVFIGAVGLYAYNTYIKDRF